MLHRWINTLLLIACLAGIGYTHQRQSLQKRILVKHETFLDSALEELDVTTKSLMTQLALTDIEYEGSLYREYVEQLNTSRRVLAVRLQDMGGE